MESAPLPLYTQAIRIEASIGLDGATPGPSFLQTPTPGISLDPNTNELVISVDRIGLLNLTGGPGNEGSRSDRYVKSIRIYGPIAPLGGDNVGIAFDGVLQRTELEIDPASNGIYSSIPFLVPQGAQLYLDNMLADNGEPVIVRLGIWRPVTLGDLTSIIESACAAAECVSETGFPCFIRNL